VSTRRSHCDPTIAPSRIARYHDPIMRRVIQMSLLLIGVAIAGKAEPLCIAHRGYSSEYPENSMVAITKAWDAGATVVEVDVRMTADHTLVLHHDATVNDQAVATLSLTELREHVPHVVLLVDVLKLASPTNQLLLDLKSREADLAATLHQEMSDLDLRPQALLVQSGSLDDLAAIGQLLPAVPRFYVSDLQRRGWLQREPRASTLRQLMEEHQLSGVTIKGRRFITRGYLKELQQDERRAFIWTVNDPRRIKHYIRIGADGIITDNPRLLQPSGE
jgi:glycerophosphoryl diester phosphodiesterase